MYTLKFLSSDEFDRLPYKGASTALGLADQNKGVAYVRDNANPMDVFTAFHELEHLKGDDLGEHESPDEKGVYYKDGGGWMQTLAPLAAFIPGVGPAISAGMGIGGSAMSSRNAQRQSQQPNINPSLNMPMPQVQQVQQPQSPNVVQTGGTGSPAMGGGGGGAVGRIRSDMELGNAFRNMKGNYAGRGGF